MGITVVLNKLARKHGRAQDLYNRLMGSWGHRPDRQRVTIKLGERDLQVLESLNLRKGLLGQDVLPSGWLATYQHPRNSELEVKVHSKTKPPRRRTFRVGGKKRQLVIVAARRIDTKHSKEATMARAATKGKPRKPKQVDEDELEGLEDLEDLEDLEEELEDDEEEDEPDDEDEEEDEDEEPAPKRRGRAAAKKAPAKKAASTRKRKAAVEEEDEDEEDEDEEPAPKRSSKTKAASSKSKTAAKSSATKAKAKGNGNLPATRELPKGQVGPQEIAELVGGDCDSRYVRIYLRENYERPEGGRWAFGKQEARSIAKEIKTQRRKNS